MSKKCRRLVARFNELDLPCLEGGDSFREKVRIRVLNVLLFYIGCYELRDEVLGSQGVYAPRFKSIEEMQYEARVLASQVKRVRSILCQGCPFLDVPPACWFHVGGELNE